VENKKRDGKGQLYLERETKKVRDKKTK